MREQENQGSENCAAYPSADTSSDTLMGGLHTVGHYLDPYQPTRALTRRILSTERLMGQAWRERKPPAPAGPRANYQEASAAHLLKPTAS